MKTEHLITILDAIDDPKAILEVLRKKNLSITARTDEGDSILHALAKSQHGAFARFNDYLTEIISAGADVNATDSQGKGFLSYYLEKNETAVVKETLIILLNCDTFNVHEMALVSYAHHLSWLELQMIVNHPRFETTWVDENGNNWLQLTVMSNSTPELHTAFELMLKIFDIAHRNHQNESILDLILQNTANRTTSANNELLLALLEFHPSFLLDKYPSGEIVGAVDNCPITDATPTCRSLTSASMDPADKPRDAGLGVNWQHTLLRRLLEENHAHWKFPIIFRKYKAIARDLGPFEQAIQEFFPAISNAKKTAGLRIIYGEWIKLCLFGNFELTSEQRYLWNRKPDKDNHKLDSRMFAHLFSLSGQVPDDDGQLLMLTGSYKTETGPFILHLMNEYISDCQRNRKHPEEIMIAIKEARRMSIVAMRLAFLFSAPGGIIKRDKFLSLVMADIEDKGIEVYTGWPLHEISIIFYQKGFYRINGGGCSTDATTEYYKLTRLENLTIELILKLCGESDKEENKPFIQQKLHQILGLEYVGPINGKFQDVGNCSFASKLTALEAKLSLFLEKAIAHKLYTEIIAFFEQFYLDEYLSRYFQHPCLPHILMRLVIQKLIPDGKFELASRLLKEHFKSESRKEIMQAEFMIKKWLLSKNGGDGGAGQFDNFLTSMGVTLNTNTGRLEILDRFLQNTFTQNDITEISTAPDVECFQSYHLLHIAVGNDNPELVKLLIGMFPKAVNQANWYKEAPLCLAQSVEMISILIEAGANTTSTDYKNALDRAIIANKPPLVLALLKHGAKPSQDSAYLAATKNPAILQYLMKYHPEALKTRTHDYSLAIHAAAASGNKNTLEILIDSGLDPEASNVNGITPLHSALKSGQKSVANVLINYPFTLFKAPHRGDPPEKMTSDSQLQQAIIQKRKQNMADLEHYQKYKERNPGVALEDIDFLITAICNGDLSAIRGCFLANRNINVVEISKLHSITPLAAAMQNLAEKKGTGNKEAFATIELLLSTRRININTRMPTNKPLFLMATSIGKVGILELFLAEDKLDVNQQDDSGCTALHIAVGCGYLDCVVRLLQDARIDSSIMNKSNQTPADIKSLQFGVAACAEKVAEHQGRMQAQQQVVRF